MTKQINYRVRSASTIAMATVEALERRGTGDGGVSAHGVQGNFTLQERMQHETQAILAVRSRDFGQAAGG